MKSSLKKKSKKITKAVKPNKKPEQPASSPRKKYMFVAVGTFVAVAAIYNLGYFFPQTYIQPTEKETIAAVQSSVTSTPALPPLDTVAYNRKLAQLAHVPTSTPVVLTNATNTPATTTPITKRLWPVKTVYPNAGALLPFNRIVAFYGNLYSTKMGVLGEYPKDEMLAKLKTEVKNWQDADPTTPVIPALHYIVTTAQGSPGDDGKYRLRMPYSEIDKVISMAAEVNGIVFLDFQVSLSDLQSELPIYEKYLKMPQVHLGIDPEFSMKTGKKPGTVIGTFDASDINYATDYLAKLVKENNLTPKVLIVHRFTQAMVTNYKQIKVVPEVQFVMDMDGWGSKERKIGTYNAFIYGEPVQFTGFKLFYKNDFREPGSRMMTPQEVLKLTPSPSYIQYQ